MPNEDLNEMSDEKLIELWYHYNQILERQVSMSDIYRHMDMEAILVRRGYGWVDGGIGKVA